MAAMAVGGVDDLYQRFGPIVYRRARALLGDDEAAWDVVQEVFVRTLRGQDGFRNEASPTTWLYRITTNYCFNMIRDANRRRTRLAEQAALGAHRDDGAAPPPPELRLMLAEILELIPQQLCEIAVYYYVDRMTQEEIAAVVGVSRKTVGNRLAEFHARADALVGFKTEVLA